MNPKVELTRKVLEILRPGASEKELRIASVLWWFNSRKKEQGGLRLTEKGCEALVNAGIKSYAISFENPIDMNNQFIIRLDQLMDCPFYITANAVHVFGEKMAVQLVLFSGDLKKFISAKADRTIA
jgi:hypothetical protein